MTAKELQEILGKHKLWLIGDPKGVRANLSYANLSYADLSGANLSYANLSYADLCSADLRSADLVFVIFGKYCCYIQKAQTRIGCVVKPNKFWLECKTADVAGFSIDAAEWWKEYGTLIRAMIKQLQKKKEPK